jgi:hypothetical protein
MIKRRNLGISVAMAVLLSVGAFATVAYANHSWGNYHWARTTSSFTLKLGDNVSTAWDSHLATASVDWSLSSVLDTTVVTGGAKRNCGPIKGRVEICNSKYGNNGWLGIAQIWVSGSHITQGVVKLNDTYFNKSPYNAPAWRRLVMCQEIGHTFGLDHQDEAFGNTNLGTCMDYTSNPSGPPSNEHPNAHDYEQLELIYAHLDSVTTVGQIISPSRGQKDDAEMDVDKRDKVIRKDGKNRPSLYERDLGRGEKVFTFVTWAD